MERRLLTFILCSTAFFLIYAALRARFVPPEVDPVAQQADADGDVLVDAIDDRSSTDGDDNSTSEANAESEADPNADKDEKTDEPAVKRPTRPQWSTLGSMDPSTGYFMLVTLNSRGGGIERIELTERNDAGELKYRRVDVRYGYLGYVAGETSSKSDGVVVNVVGPGTPADLAGMQVGDVIVAVAGSAVVTPEDIEATALVNTKPGDNVSVDVMRGDSVTPTVLRATLTQHPLDLVRLAEYGGPDQVVGNLSRLSCLVSLSQVNRKGILTNEESIAGVDNPAQLIWTPNESTESDAQSPSAEAEYTLELSAAEMNAVGGGPIRMRRGYTLAPSTYAIEMSIQIDNLDDQPQDLAYRLEGANGITLEGWWYSTKISPNFSGAAARDIVYKTKADGHELISGYDLLKRAKNEVKDPHQTIYAPDGDADSRNMKYIGIDAQYFTVAYTPPAGSASFSTFRRASAGIAADPTQIPRHQERAVNSTFFLDSAIATVPAGASLRQNLQLFAGPKRPELLEPYGLGDCIYYGWFATFAKALGWLLHLLSGVGNYAIAIILLTVIVRGLMFPLSRQSGDQRSENARARAGTEEDQR